MVPVLSTFGKIEPCNPCNSWLEFIRMQTRSPQQLSGLLNFTGHCCLLLKGLHKKGRPFRIIRNRPVLQKPCHANLESQDPAPGVWADSTISRRQAHISVLALALVASTTAGQAQAQTGRPLEGPVKDAVIKAFRQTAEKSKAPVLLRLAFHDAATHRVSQGDGGANASIQYEFERPENNGLKRGWRVIEKVMERLKGTPAEGVVSYADLIALGGSYAVAVTGGPVIDIPIGRRDTTVPDPTDRLPEETLSAEALRLHFAAMGMSPQELVALSGAHTLGSKGYGDPVTFDNVYYTALLKKPWDDPSNSMASMIGLPSDHVLPDDSECRPFIVTYAASQQKFFQDFGTAYAKLTMLGAQWM